MWNYTQKLFTNWERAKKVKTKSNIIIHRSTIEKSTHIFIPWKTIGLQITGGGFGLKKQVGRQMKLINNILEFYFLEYRTKR